jgi:hypothetical protein
MRKRSTILITAAGLLIGMAGAGTAHGAITVANQNDSGSGSLRQAIADASPGETINLPAGTYTLTSERLVIQKSLTIAGHGSGDTIIRAGAPIQIFVIVGPGPTPIDVAINDVTIREALNTEANPAGGGVLSVNANLTLRRVWVTNNVVSANGEPGLSGGTAQGAGILTIGGFLNLQESTVTGNTATAVGGKGAEGGTAEGAGVEVVGTYRIEKSTISNNLADARGGQGPPSAAQDGGTAEGAGLLAVAGEKNATSIVASTLNGNIADASAGPGGSAGTSEGAGLLEVISGSATWTNATLASNIARAQGGAGEESLGAGALVVVGPKGSLVISSSTIASNRMETSTPEKGFGGNIYTVGSVAIRNSIVADGFGPPGQENCFGVPQLNSLGFNLESLNQCGFAGVGDQVNKSPQLGPLQLNGGLTATMAPALGSPAIDQGAGFGVGSDQRGILRPIDFPSIANPAPIGADGADVGAVELQPSNAFSLGKLKKNKKKGRARLSVFLPQPSVGTLTLEGKGLKTQRIPIGGQGEVKLLVLPKGKVQRALNKRGKRKVKMKVTYAPTGNSAATSTRKAKLVKKHKKRKRKAAKR